MKVKVAIAWVYAEIFFNKIEATEEVITYSKGMFNPFMQVMHHKYEPERRAYKLIGVVPGQTMAEIHKYPEHLIMENGEPTQHISVLMTYN